MPVKGIDILTAFQMRRYGNTFPRASMEIEYGFTPGAGKENCHTQCFSNEEVC